MASSSNHGAAKGKLSRVLLRFTRDSLRIPEELAGEIGAEEAVVVAPPAGGKVKLWPVEVGKDGDGAFLGHGWPEFAEACGVEPGWHLILRHRGRGVLTVKVFDASNCLMELGGGASVLPAVEARESSKDAARNQKPQFIRVFPRYFMGKLLIPPTFVQRYIGNENLNSRTATVLGPLGKVSHVELEKNCSDEFFVGGWSQFLVSNNITETDSLLLSYGGKMVFSVKVFDPKGYQRESKHKETTSQHVPASSYIEEQEQQEAPSGSIQKHCKNNWPRQSSDGEKKPKGMVNPLNDKPLWTKPVYQIGSSLQMKKQINANTLKELALAKRFCDAIGLHGRSTITLKTSMSSTDSWKVQALPSKTMMSYRLMQGWRRFCLENNLKLGDICTFEVIETTLWHVTINNISYENPSSSSRKRDTMTSESSNNGQKRPKGSSDALITDYVSARGCVFGIGPPAWIKKEINSTTFESRVYLPPAFCKAIGIWEPCTITLKTSVSNTRSWQAHIAPYEGSSHHVSGLGWTQFCRENRIKVGDVCTINIVETKLWHVIVNSPE